MHQEEVCYQQEGKVCKGLLVKPDPSVAKQGQAVLVAHAWMGRDEFACEKARALAALGYIAFAVDMYGEGIQASDPKQAGELMMPLFADRALLQKRIRAAFDTLAQQAGVDKNKIGAIGFCFGGLTVIELLRSGAPVKGVVSIHGGFGSESHGIKAKTVPIADNVKGSLLILHGHDDPLVTQQDILSIQKEMTDAKVDWQMHIYGHTSHAFTNPKADNPNIGLIYSERSCTRALDAMRYFLEHTLA